MRPQKGHLTPVIKVVNGNAVFDRTKYMHAGYTTYDCILVGGAGGYGGRSYYNGNNYAYGAGGGGGGLLRIQGDLRDLPTDWLTLEGGYAGTKGADQGNKVTGNTGTTGGTSSFGFDWRAFGGKGGGGGRVDFTSGIGGSANLSDGGDGGGNSLGLGTIGIGSTGGADAAAPNHTAATAGSAAAISTTVGGGGGGGETGKVETNNLVMYAATFAAKNGNVNATEGTTGPGGATSSNKGGCGGGGNIALVTGGATEYYGSYALGSDPNGVAYLKLV